LFNILETLEDIVTSKIISKDDISSSDFSFDELFDLAKSEQERIKKRLFELVFSISCEQNICLFFYHYQTRLINLSNLLFHYIDCDANILNLRQAKLEVSQFRKISFIQLIDELLSHSHDYYSKFLDPDCVIPNKLREVAIKQFDCFIDDFNTISDVLPGNLLEIISEPILNFIANPDFATYYNLKYLTKFTSDLLVLKEQSEENQLFSSLKIRLFYLNFNALSFFNYFTNEIRESVLNIETYCGKIEKLAWFHKEVNQLPLKKSIAYNQNQKSIHDLVSHWIIEEMCFLEKSFELSTTQIKDSKNSISPVVKILTNLSVPQIAYLLKIFVETEILNSQNDSELIKNIAAITRTKKAVNISSESLRVKYYSVEEKVKDEVKDIIIKLLNHINKS
jgi:hypothetical protein